MIKNNYHTHMRFCNHAIGDVADYVEAAISFGFNELGMTDHAPIPNVMTKEEWDNNWCDDNMLITQVPQYLNQIKKCQEKYKNIKIYSGFETEFVPSQLDYYKDLRSKVDYLNLGIHYFVMDNKIMNTYADITYKNLKYYVNNCIEGMKSGLYNTLVHPDLFMFSYKNIEGKREYDDEAIKATRSIIEAAIKYNCYLEINANGLKNSATFGTDSKWLYPYEDFWVIAKEYKDLKILIGADAHDPAHLANENVAKVCEFAERLGLKIEEKMIINH